MIEISLTTFVDYLIATSSSRISVVRRAKKLYSQDYNPAFDFWRPFRKTIEEMHRENLGKGHLDLLQSNLSDKNKRNAYTKNIIGYKKWMGRKKFEWISSVKSSWRSDELTVNINPELNVKINGIQYIIKLYLKADKLTKHRVNTILYLLKESIKRRRIKATPAILDVKNSKLIKHSRDISGINALLNAEAISFINLFENL